MRSWLPQWALALANGPARNLRDKRCRRKRCCRKPGRGDNPCRRGRRRLALGRRCAQRLRLVAGIVTFSQRRTGERRNHSRRHRDEDQGRLAHLLALSRRRRRAASLRLCGIAERQERGCALARAAAHPRAGPGRDRLWQRRNLAARHRAAGSRKAGDAASQARLRRVRETVRAGGSQGRAGARRRPLVAGGRARQCRSASAEEARARRRHAARRQVGAEGRRRRGRPRVIVDVAAPAGSAAALFAEGPTPDWALPVPAAIDGAPAGLQRFAFDLDGAPPGAKYQGVPITLTAVAGNSAIEVVTRLD